MVFIQDIVRGTELTIASGGPPGGLPAATADPRQTPSPAARLAQARQKMDAPFWPAAHSTSLLRPFGFIRSKQCGTGGRERGGKAGSGQVEMGGALLSGGLRSFGLLHCGIRSRRHCGARMAAPGTAIVENERDGQHWGRHLPHGVTVAQCSVRISSRVTSEK